MLLGVSEVNLSRPRTPRSEVRERILRAAMNQFADRGFAGATIDAIADAAGFTKGSVYSNFNSKDDLFFALLDEQLEQRTEAVAALAALTTYPTIDDLGRLLTNQLRGNRNWQLLFTEYWLRAMRDPKVHERFVLHRREFRASIEALAAQVLQAQQGQTIEPSSVAVLVLALNNGLSIEEFSIPGSVPDEMFGEILRSVVQPSRRCSHCEEGSLPHKQGIEGPR